MSDTLHLSGHALRQEPRQLASQLVGRLQGVLLRDKPKGAGESRKFPNLLKLLDAARGSSVPVSPECCESQTRGRYHGGRRPSSDDSFHSPTVIPPPALDKPSIVKRYYRRRTCSDTSPRRSPTMVTLHDTRFVECRWLNDGWNVKTIVT